MLFVEYLYSEEFTEKLLRKSCCPAWCRLGTLLVTGKFVAAAPADQCFPGFFSERLQHQAADHSESDEIFRADVEDLSCQSQQMKVCRSR